VRDAADLVIIINDFQILALIDDNTAAVAVPKMGMRWEQWWLPCSAAHTEKYMCPACLPGTAHL
jgi:hypothetical protein